MAITTHFMNRFIERLPVEGDKDVAEIREMIKEVMSRAILIMSDDNVKYSIDYESQLLIVSDNNLITCYKPKISSENLESDINKSVLRALVETFKQKKIDYDKLIEEKQKIEERLKEEIIYLHNIRKALIG